MSSLNDITRKLREAEEEKQREKQRRATLPNIHKAKLQILMELYTRKVLLNDITKTSYLNDEELLKLSLKPFNPVYLVKSLQKDGLIDVQTRYYDKNGTELTGSTFQKTAEKIDHRHYITTKAIKLIEYHTQGLIDDKLNWDTIAQGMALHSFIKNRKAQTVIDMDYKDEINAAISDSKKPTMNVGSNNNMSPEIIKMLFDKILK